VSSELFRRDYTTKADVYSFALTTHEAIVRQIPFSDYTWSTAIQNAVVAGERPEWIRDIPDKVRSMVESSWLGSPGERPSFAEIENSIRAILEEVHTYPKLTDLVKGRERAPSKVPDIPKAQEECREEYEKLLEDLWVAKSNGANLEDFIDTVLLITRLLKLNPINVPVPPGTIAQLRARLEDWRILFAQEDYEGPVRIKLEQINLLLGNL